MKKSIPIIFLFISLSLFSQTIESVDLYKYLNLEEDIAIKNFDNDFKGKTIKKFIRANNFYFQDKYKFILYLVENYNMNTKNLLKDINKSETYCGVGHKYKKDMSPSCKQSINYVENKNSAFKKKLVDIAFKNGEKPDEYAFLNCVKRNELDLFKLYRENDTGGLITNEFLNKLAIESARNGFIDFVKYFLDNGVSINAVDKYSNLLGVSVSYPETFFFLIEKGIKYKYEDQIRPKYNKVGLSTFSLATIYGCTEVVQFFIDKKIDPKEVKGRVSPLQNAKGNKKNKKEILKILKTYKN